MFIIIWIRLYMLLWQTIINSFFINNSLLTTKLKHSFEYLKKRSINNVCTYKYFNIKFSNYFEHVAKFLQPSLNTLEKDE